MNKNIPILSGLLLLQLVFAGVLFSTDSDQGGNDESKFLVNINSNELSQIKIIDSDAQLVFSNLGSKWRLEGYPELELLNNKVKSLTEDLSSTKVTWPITRTHSSHERFKVASDQFEKKVVFSDKDGNEQTLLLGNAPNFKQLYVRNVNQDDVFSIEYSNYQLSTDADDWLDKSLLAINDISKISHAAINLEKGNDNWQVAPPSTLADQQTIDTTSIENFVNQLTTLSVSGIAEDSINASNKLTVHDQQGNKFVYFFASNDEQYFVKREDIDQWFTIAQLNFETLANLSFDKFIFTPVKQKEAVGKASN